MIFPFKQCPMIPQMVSLTLREFQVIELIYVQSYRVDICFANTTYSVLIIWVKGVTELIYIVVERLVDPIGGEICKENGWLYYDFKLYSIVLKRYLHLKW